MMTNTLDRRLLSAADFVRAGAVFADIGTDHAYLPIFLLKEKRIKRAVCSDVNEGPLKSAMINVAASGLSELCDFVLTDGASELAKYGITDFAVCGMGGELIARIIDDAPFMKSVGTRLILQPMSKQAYLREYLYKSGFSVISERYSESDGKFYVCLLAEYTGNIKTIDSVESELGLPPFGSCDVREHIGYLEAKRRAYARKIDGIEKGGGFACAERAIALAIDERLEALRASIR